MRSALRFILLSAVSCFVALHAKAVDIAARDSLNTAIAQASTASDSLKVMFDLLDTSPYNDRAGYAEKVYRLAIRSHNVTAQLEMLRIMSNLYAGNDSLQAVQQQRAEALPDSRDQRETLTFIKMMRITTKARTASESDCIDLLFRELNDYEGDKKSTPEQQMLHLYSVCMFLGNNPRSSMLTGYVDKLGMLVRQLSYQNEGIRHLYFTQAARIYTLNGDTKEAVAADREMLQGIERLMARHHRQGRRYRHYEAHKYVCYRRMLSNYKSLGPQEADSLYENILHLAEVNPDVAADLASDPRARAYYLLAKGRNAEAVPLLREIVDNPKNKSTRTLILRDMRNAARAAGDREAELYASTQYADAIEGMMNASERDRMNELQVVYNVASLQKERDAMEMERHGNDLRWHRIILTVSGIVLLILLVALVVVSRFYRKARKLSMQLTEANRDITEERDKLQRTQKNLIMARDKAHRAADIKSDFVSSMSREVNAPLNAIVEYSQFIVDNMDEKRRKYLEGFAEVVTLSAELLQTLINNALDVSSIEREEAVITKRPVSVQSMCHMAIENVRKKVAPGVELSFANAGEPDRIITTDPGRVEQVLLNLLGNAAKFTESGNITLSYSGDAAAGTITFAVTDTGPGIPEGKEEVIFERFEKVNAHTQGSGLGLYICSLVSRLLGGSVSLDTSYRDGARFLFTIPV